MLNSWAASLTGLAPAAPPCLSLGAAGIGSRLPLALALRRLLSQAQTLGRLRPNSGPAMASCSAPQGLAWSAPPSGARWELHPSPRRAPPREPVPPSRPRARPRPHPRPRPSRLPRHWRSGHCGSEAQGSAESFLPRCLLRALLGLWRAHQSSSPGPFCSRAARAPAQRTGAHCCPLKSRFGNYCCSR